VGKRCYVGNLAFKTSWQELKDHFRQAGNVVHAKVLEDEASGTSKGCGIVEFGTSEEAAKAINLLHDKELHGRLLTVREDREDRDLKPGAKGGHGKGLGSRDRGVFSSSLSDVKRIRTSGNFDNAVSSHGAGADAIEISRRCYVGNLSYRTSWQDLKDHFKQVGKVVYTSVMEEKPGRSKGCGIVEFETAEEAGKAVLTLHDSELNGRQIFVREDREDRELKQVSGTGWKGSRGKGGCGGGGGGSCESRRGYVGNLSYRTSWQDLKDHFRQIGKVVYSNVMEESGSGRSKGCGIVEFESSRDASKAIEVLHDSVVNGRQIFVREDREDRDLK